MNQNIMKKELQVVLTGLYGMEQQPRADNPKVVAKLNAKFYSVKMGAETTDTIYFGGKQFVISTVNDRRIGFHELAVL